MDVQLAKALKKEYPFKPWPQTPVYQLLEQPELKNKLTWLVEQYAGKEEIKQWAAFVLKYVCPEGQTENDMSLKELDELCWSDSDWVFNQMF